MTVNNTSSLSELIPLQLRNDVVNQTNGSVTLHTKYHYEDMVSNFAITFAELSKIRQACLIQQSGCSKEISLEHVLTVKTFFLISP